MSLQKQWQELVHRFHAQATAAFEAPATAPQPPAALPQRVAAPSHRRQHAATVEEATAAPLAPPFG